MFKLRVYLFLLGLILTFAGCVPDERMRTTEEPPSVEDVFGDKEEVPSKTPASPIDGMEISTQSFDWVAQNGSSLDLSNGSKLNIPPHALVDAEGAPVSGRVSLGYRQFQDVGEIFLSGLSMHFDSAGLRGLMRSSGMLEIRANKNGEALFVAPGKSLELIMPAASKGPFNLYHYDENDNRWTFVLSRQAEPEAIKASQRRGKLPPPPVKPEKISPTDILFNYDVQYEHLVELQAYFGLQWAYAGQTRNGSLDPQKETWIMKENWQAVTLERFRRNRGQYMLNLKNSEQTVKVMVRPVMEPMDHDIAMVQYMQDKSNYDDLKAAYDKETAAFASRRKMLRKCAINQFGYYNWDLPISPKEFAVLEASFKPAISGPANKGENFNMVYLVLPEEKTVVAYPKDQWQTFRYMPASKNQILAVGKEDRFYMLDSQAFDLAKGKSSYTFNLRQIDKKIESVDDLKKLLDGGV